MREFRLESESRVSGIKPGSAKKFRPKSGFPFRHPVLADGFLRR